MLIGAENPAFYIFDNAKLNFRQKRLVLLKRTLHFKT